MISICSLRIKPERLILVLTTEINQKPENYENQICVFYHLCFINSIYRKHFSTITKSRRYWAQWRGLLATGAAVKGNPPIQFSETKNLKWKTPIPGKGHATPI